MSRLWNVWGVNPSTEQLVQLVIIAEDHLSACRQMERCGLLLVDAAEYHEQPASVVTG
jgi:hypothetical protein